MPILPNQQPGRSGPLPIPSPDSAGIGQSGPTVGGAGGSANAPNSGSSPPGTITYSPAGPYTFKVGQQMPTLTPTVTGGVPVTWGVAPSLPGGISLDILTGLISGTPTTQTAQAAYTVTATNAFGSAAVVLTITVNAPVPPGNIVYPPHGSFLIGVGITPLVPTFTGDLPITWTIAPAVPFGLLFDVDTGTLSGTPVQVWDATHVVTATNAFGFATANLAIKVVDAVNPPTDLSYDPNPVKWVLAQAVNMIPQISGGTATSWNVVPSLPAGMLLTQAGLIQGSPSLIVAPLVYDITASNSAGSASFGLTGEVVHPAPSGLTYTPAGPYVFVRDTAITPLIPSVTGTVLSWAVAPALPTGVSLNTANGIITGTPTAITPSASYVVTATNGGGSTTATLIITVNDKAPTSITYSPNPASFVEDLAITPLVPVVVGGTPTTWMVAPALPSGLSINAASGIISGTPVAPVAIATYTVTGLNVTGQAQVGLQITITVAPPTNLVYLGSPFTFTDEVAITPVVPTNSGGTIASYGIAPALSAGLALSTSTGILSGTPTVKAALVTYTVTGTNAAGSTQASLIITVRPAIPSGLSYAASPFTGEVNTSVGTLLPTLGQGEDITYSVVGVVPLPPGLMLSPTTGAITGTPTTPQASMATTIEARNVSGATTFPFVFIINVERPRNLSYSPDPVTWTNSVAITPMSPTSGGGPVASYAVQAGAFPAGITVSTSTGIITGTATVNSSGNVTIRASNVSGFSDFVLDWQVTGAPGGAPENLLYAPPGPYLFTKSTAITSLVPSTTGGAPTNYAVVPALPSGLIISASTGIISGTPTAITAQNTHTVTASNVSGSTTLDLVIRVRDAAPTSITYTPNPATFQINDAVSMTPTVMGGAATSFSINLNGFGIPLGLTFSNVTGVISGTAQALYSGLWTITATNETGSANVNLTFNIVEDAPFSLVYATDPWTIAEDASVTQTPTVGGTPPFVFSVTPSLPTGLILNTSTGTISGAAANPQATTPYTVTATNPSGSTNFVLDIIVTATALTSLDYTPAGPYSFPVGIAIAPLIAVTLGGNPVSFGVAPALPTGLSLNTTSGEITGTPTVSGLTAMYTVTATNTVNSVQKVLTITIIGAPPSGLSYPNSNMPTFVVGVSVGSYTPTVTGTVTSWTIGTPLPPGLAFSTSTGIITGTPTGSSHGLRTSHLVTAINGSGSTTATLQILVDPAAPTSLNYPSNSYTFTQGVAITPQTPTVVGEDLTFSSDPLPAGLSINPVNGTMSGTPTVSLAATDIVFRAANVTGQATDTNSITVNAAAPSNLTYSPPGPYVFPIGTPITSLVPSNSGGAPTSYAVAPPLPNAFITESMGTVTVQPGTVLPTNPTPLIYAPPETTTPAANHRINVFIPQGTPPPGGWAVFLFNMGGGFAATVVPASLTPTTTAVAHAMLNAGFAVVGFGITGSTDTAGWFTPPLDPSGRWENHNYFMPEKDAVWAIQYTKVVLSAQFPINVGRIACHGSSSGGHVLEWATMGADRKFATGSNQIKASTAVRGCAPVKMNAAYTAFLNTQGTNDHWESSTVPGTGANTVADVNPTLLRNSSAIATFLEVGSMAGATAWFSAYDEIIGSTVYTLDGSGYPTLTNTLGGAQIHPAWGGYIGKSRLSTLYPTTHGNTALAALSQLWIGNGTQTTAGSLAGTESGVFNGTLPNVPTVITAEVTWAIAAVSSQIPDPNGLVINTTTGIIGGTPNVQQVATNHIVTASNASGSTPATLNITVNAPGSGSGTPFGGLGMMPPQNESFSRSYPWADAAHHGGYFKANVNGTNTATFFQLLPIGVTGETYPDPAFITATNWAYAEIHNAALSGFFELGVYVLTWSGTGNCNLVGGVNNVTSSTSNRKTINMTGLGSGGLQVEITVSSAADPVRNVHLWRPGYELAGKLYHDGFVLKMQQLSAGAGPDHIRLNWWTGSLRAGASPGDPRAFIQTLANRSKPGQWKAGTWQSVPWEYYAPLANAVGCDLWLTIPHPTSSLNDTDYTAFVQAMAGIVLNGGSGFAGLSANFKVIIEWANEWWNTALPAANWVASTATAQGTSTAQVVATYSKLAFDAWMSVWTGVNAARVERVMMGQLGTSSQLSSALAALPTSYKMDAVGCAWYFGPSAARKGNGVGGYLNAYPANLPTTQTILNDIDASIDADMIPSVKAHIGLAVAHSATCKAYLYEGGPSLTPTGPPPPQASWWEEAWLAARDPQMYGIVQKAIDRLATSTQSGRGITRAAYFGFQSRVECPVGIPDSAWGVWEKFDDAITLPVPEVYLDQGLPKAAAVYKNAASTSFNAPPITPPAPASWEVQPTLYIRLSDGMVFPVADGTSPVAVIKASNPGETILVNGLMPIVSEMEIGGGDPNKNAKATWQNTGNAGIPMNMTIIGKNAGEVDQFPGHGYSNGFGGYLGNVDGIRFQNLRLRGQTFAQACISGSTGQVYGRVKIYNCTILNSGGSTFGGYGHRMGIRSQGEAKWDIRGCHFGALRTHLVPDGVALPGFEQHNVYVDHPVDSYFIDLTMEYTGKTFIQIVYRPAEFLNTNPQGTCLIERVHGTNIWGGGGACFNFTCYQGNLIVLRDCTHSEGPVNITANQSYRPLVVYEIFEPLQGTAYSVPGGHSCSATVKIEGLTADLPRMRDTSHIAIQGAARVEFHKFDLKNTGAAFGKYAIELDENIDQSGTTAPFGGTSNNAPNKSKNGPVVFFVKGSDGLPSSYTGFATSGGLKVFKTFSAVEKRALTDAEINAMAG